MAHPTHGRIEVLVREVMNDTSWQRNIERVVRLIDGGDKGAARDGRLNVAGVDIRESMPTRRHHWFEHRKVGVLYLRPRDEEKLAVGEPVECDGREARR